MPGSILMVEPPIVNVIPLGVIVMVLPSQVSVMLVGLVMEIAPWANSVSVPWSTVSLTLPGRVGGVGEDEGELRVGSLMWMR